MAKPRPAIAGTFTAALLAAGLYVGVPALTDAPLTEQLAPASAVSGDQLQALETRYFMVIPGGSRPLP